MREPPPHVTDSDVLHVVRAEWDGLVDTVEHLPVGFGAHHWAANAHGVRLLFVTFDQLLPRHLDDELEDAYAAAADLHATGLEFVLPTLPSRSGRRTVPLAGGALNVTAWRDGRPGDGTIADGTELSDCARMLARLHAVDPPPRTPRWRPLVSTSLPEDLADLLEEPWQSGPYAVRAREALVGHLDDLTRWTTRYHDLARQAHDVEDSWVATHGEPDTGNHLVTETERLLVDWESLKVAPRERDLRVLVDRGHPWRVADVETLRWPMIEMFDLEWRLDEVAQYAAWFAAPHTGTASDDVAFAGLLEELERESWCRP